jgi:PAS domain S-box-containing protein
MEQADGVSFPSIAPPPNCTTPSTLTDFQKVLKMKNAMLRAIEIPLVAMRKDESVVLPNLAAQKLLEVEADPVSEHSYDFMSRLRPWTPDFSREIDENSNPIVTLCRDQQAFTNWRIGLLNEKTGARSNFDVSGHPVYDERSGEFLAGLIAFKDVTEYTEQIAHQTAENEEQFRLICDMMPQMIFTTTPDGLVTYWSQRWYDYTGLTPADSLGHGWKLPFHEEDMPDTTRRWLHSLATGEEYTTEYRCKGVDGQWRWMLGRALPMRDHKTGKILKWFGTCTDIQDIVDAKVSGQRARQQLLDVLKHSQMAMWIIDREQTVTFYEGDSVMGDSVQGRIIGSQVLDVVGDYLAPQAIAKFKDALARLLSGASDLEILENEVNSRWFRSKMVPMKGKTGPNGVEDENYIAGVIVIGSDVTGIRRKEQENIKLLANETAAKEASKMKSSFLANMSHEIRTPIAGVLGMTELLTDTNLDSEQTEFAQNIQRSANSLLTVINDILDFSKIESGRLDIEEVQFSLGVVLRDVAKMLSFAAQRKGLQFGSDIRLGPSEDLILLGDPGRIRQILVNLLTNSIKFTSEGYVRLSADILSQDLDTVTVEFCVEDSGIGIEEEVKKRLFRPFSQADSSTARRFGGTGLGLTISKNLVDLMHGTIHLDSKLDAGTKATFSLPLKRPEYQVGSPTAFLEVGNMPDRLQSDLSMSIGDSPRPESRRFERGASLLHSAAATNAHDRCVVGIPSESGTQIIEPELPRDQIHILVVEGRYTSKYRMSER